MPDGAVETWIHIPLIYQWGQSALQLAHLGRVLVEGLSLFNQLACLLVDGPHLNLPQVEPLAMLVRLPHQLRMI